MVGKAKSRSQQCRDARLVKEDLDIPSLFQESSMQANGGEGTTGNEGDRQGDRSEQDLSDDDENWWCYFTRNLIITPVSVLIALFNLTVEGVFSAFYIFSQPSSIHLRYSYVDFL